MYTAIENNIGLEVFIETSKELLFKKLYENASVLPPSSSDIVLPEMVTDDPTIYFVKDYYELSDDEGMLVFEVINTQTKGYYCVFVHNGYLCLPAFMADRLQITDYACLGVGDIDKYYYILISTEGNISLSSFKDNELRSRILGQHHFVVPQGDNKILTLNAQNKTIQNFIVVYSNFDLVDERDIFVARKTEFLEKSSVKPSYRFVPEVVAIKFHAAYAKFAVGLQFTRCFLVHTQSVSFEELTNISKMKMKIQEIQYQTQTLANIFNNTEYSREEYILGKLENHIKKVHSTAKGGQVTKYYSSVMAILQSSGYGKSKLMEKLGTKTPVFYSSLQPGTGYPTKTFLIDRLLGELDVIVRLGLPNKDECFMNNVAIAVYIYILRLMYVILKMNNSGNIKLDKCFQVDDILKFPFHPTGELGVLPKNEAIFKILFRNLDKICILTENIDFDGQNTLLLAEISRPVNLSFINKFDLGTHADIPSTDRLEHDVMVMLKSLKDVLGTTVLPALFVVDEAHSLIYQITDTLKRPFNWGFQSWDSKENRIVTVKNRAPYNVLRLAFRLLKNSWVEFILILISTSGQIGVLVPHLYLDPSRRATGSGKLMENFILLQTYCVNSEISREIHADMFPNPKYDLGIQNWKEFLSSKFRITEYFKFGRPLIYGYYKIFVESDLVKNDYNCEEDFEKCDEFWILGSKLFGGKKYGQTDHLSLLHGMFNFAFGVNFVPSCIRKEDLIESYLMTLIEYIDEGDSSDIIGSYLPESVFGLLSAKYFVQYEVDLEKIISCSIKYGLCHIGNFGELMAQYVLIKCVFRCIDPLLKKIRKLAFQPVNLRDFLIMLTGNEVVVDEYFTTHPLLLNSHVSFGFFEHFPRNPIKRPFDIMARCLFKGSALTLNSLYKGIDLMIPLVLEDGRISFLGVQVKFVKENQFGNTINRALKKFDFSNMFGNEQENDRPFGLIILALGDYEERTETSIKANQSPISMNQTAPNSPVVIVIKGIHNASDQLKAIFKGAPTDENYRGINKEFLKRCDKMLELANEYNPEETVEVGAETPGPSGGGNLHPAVPETLGKRGEPEEEPSQSESIDKVAIKKLRISPPPPPSNE